MKRQVQYILTQLQAEPKSAQAKDQQQEGDEQSDVEEEEDDYEEDLEDGDEEDDDEPTDEDAIFDTMKIEGVLTGEEWLTSQFLLSNNEAMA